MTVLSVRDLTVRYGTGRGGVTAVDRVSFDLDRGQTLGIVGESGCGKSTVARALVGLAPVVGGTIAIDGHTITDRRRNARRRLAQQVQMIFQDPDTALDPRMSVGATLREAVGARGDAGRRQLGRECDRLLELVSLEPQIAEELPGQLSGGQKQRIAIARALAVRPRILIADEITSALDASVQGAILNLLKALQDSLDLSVIFIGHNFATVRYVSHRMAVMYLGTIVEEGPTSCLIDKPEHPYTQALVVAVPTLSGAQAGRTLLGEPGDVHSPPAGCTFHPRCPVGPTQRADREVCRELSPLPDAGLRRHGAACHFAASRSDLATAQERV